MADTLIQGTTIIEDKRTGAGSIWSCPGSHFMGTSPDTDNIAYSGTSFISNVVANETVTFTAAVFLPDGAKITKVIVYGSENDETWSLNRAALAVGSPEDTLATAAFNTEDSSVSNEIVDNGNYSYSLNTSSLDVTDIIFSARITYTT